MYLEHFGLSASPFMLGPETRFAYSSTAYGETMAHLLYGLEGGEEIVLITGEIGTGKTLALHCLIENLNPLYRIAFINVTDLNFNEFLKLVLAELDLEIAGGADRADLLTALRRELVASRSRAAKILLIVDEAQNLEMQILEDLRMLTNLAQPGAQALQIVFSGQPSLAAKIDHPELAQLKQRIRVRYELEPLSRDEIADYITHRMQVAGASLDPFARSAVDRIFVLSGGIPRLVNFLADGALLSAFVSGRSKVTAEDVEDRDLARASAAARVSISPPSPATESLPGGKSVEPAGPPPEPEPEPDPEPDPEPEPERSVPLAVRRPRRGGAGRVLGVAAAILVLAAAAWFFRAGLADLYAGLRGSGPAPVAVQPVPDIPSDVVPDDALDEERDAAVDTAVADDTETDTSAPTVVPAGNEAEPAAESIAATPEETPPAATAAAPAPLAPGFYIHVGSFLDPVRAEAYRLRLEGSGHPTVVRDRSFDGSLWHRVYVGPFVDLGAAREAELVLKREHAITYTMIHEIG